eukprot:TRINITY_DN7055_c0_g1_i5.p1 TRINITY_DN7055_c0_g1~~TRINITY_DN7055_c0_g1_i5.p1  ORF type:complete len:620 (+),score=176.64 TRINITY_DN7055_c0_g1_i5:86-1861(+)
MKLSRLYVRPSDSKESVERKTLSAAAIACIALYGLFWVLWTLAVQRDHWNIGHVAALNGGLSGVWCIAMFCCTDVDAGTVLRLYLLSCTGGIIMANWNSTAMLHDNSQPLLYALLIMAVQLLRLERWVSVTMLGCVFVYQVVNAADKVTRFGMKEASDLGHHRRVKVCECADPPCELSVFSALPLVTMIYLLVLDLVGARFTREFTEQLNMVNASVRITERVTVALGRYDIEEAAGVVLGTEGDLLPPDLRDSLAVLLKNLQAYKPYLPQSCLVAESADHTDGTPSARSSFSRKVSLQRSLRSTSTLEEEVAAARPNMAPRTDPAKRTLTLLCASTQRDADPSSVDFGDLQRRVADEVRCFTDSVSAVHGVVDLLSGEHLYASFNASRQCMQHPVKALRARAAHERGRVMSPGDVVVHTLANGPAVCGAFGSETLQRFLIMGPVPMTLGAMDGMAAKWGVQVMVDRNVFYDACHEWQFELCGACTLERATSGRLTRLYELTGAGEASGPEEWMYELDKMERLAKLHDEKDVSRWVSEVEAGCYAPAEERLRRHFGGDRVVVARSIGLDSYSRWRQEPPQAAFSLRVVELTG